MFKGIFTRFLSRFDFVPIGSKDANTYDDYSDGGFAPSWISLSTKESQIMAYSICSPLSGVIDRVAEASSNGNISIIKINDKESDVSGWNIVKKTLSLIRRPNPIEDELDFRITQQITAKIFGYCPVLFVKPFGFANHEAKYMFNLNPIFCKPKLKHIQDIDIYSDDFSLVESWDINIFGKSYNIPSSDIMVVKDGVLGSRDSDYLPISKLVGLDYFVSNIIAAVEADNVLLKKKGPLGIFSYDPKPDPAGAMPFTQKEKDALQSDLSRYGLSWNKLQYVISNKPMKWNPMSFSVQELMTKETAKQGIEAICDRIGYPAELMSGKNATYENRKSAENYMYQSNIIPLSNRIYNTYTNFFDLSSYGLKFHVDFSHLPIVQDDIVKSSQSKKFIAESLSTAYKDGIVTKNEYRDAIGQKRQKDFDLFFEDKTKNNNL